MPSHDSIPTRLGRTIWSVSTLQIRVTFPNTCKKRPYVVEYPRQKNCSIGAQFNKTANKASVQRCLLDSIVAKQPAPRYYAILNQKSSTILLFFTKSPLTRLILISPADKTRIQKYNKNINGDCSSPTFQSTGKNVDKKVI